MAKSFEKLLQLCLHKSYAWALSVISVYEWIVSLTWTV